MKDPLSWISAAWIHTTMGSFPGAWVTCWWPCLQRRLTLPPSAGTKHQDSSTGGGALEAPSPSTLAYFLTDSYPLLAFLDKYICYRTSIKQWLILYGGQLWIFCPSLSFKAPLPLLHVPIVSCAPLFHATLPHPLHPKLAHLITKVLVATWICIHSSQGKAGK